MILHPPPSLDWPPHFKPKEFVEWAEREAVPNASDAEHRRLCKEALTKFLRSKGKKAARTKSTGR